MLNSELIVNTVVSTLKTITPLNDLLGPDPPAPARPRISAFLYEGGEEVPLTKAIYEIPTPGVLVNWVATLGGNFSGMQIWKHQVEVYIKSGNMNSNPAPTGPGQIWWLICNSPVSVPGYSTDLNIRQTQILPGQLDLMDTPSIAHRQDQDLLDYFCGVFVFPEIGDN